LVRYGALILAFQNGILQNSITTNLGIYLPTTDGSCIGGTPADSNGFILGYIDEFRISNIARWTSNFQVPEIPY
jgi:hypothetical protein